MPKSITEKSSLLAWLLTALMCGVHISDGKGLYSKLQAIIKNKTNTHNPIFSKYGTVRQTIYLRLYTTVSIKFFEQKDKFWENRIKPRYIGKLK